jgi:hypothetical protein
MSTLVEPDRSPDARVVVDPDESTTDALVRAAEQADVDLAGPGAWVQDLVDGHALDHLFLHSGTGSDDGRATLVLELWGHTFVLTPGTVAVYRSESGGSAAPPN